MAKSFCLKIKKTIPYTVFMYTLEQLAVCSKVQKCLFRLKQLQLLDLINFLHLDQVALTFWSL